MLPHAFRITRRLQAGRAGTPHSRRACTLTCVCFSRRRRACEWAHISADGFSPRCFPVELSAPVRHQTQQLPLAEASIAVVMETSPISTCA
jgi:hypothetical protein